MKKIINYSGIPGLILIAALVFITALVFIPVSCSKEAVKDNPDADNSSQLIKISGEDAGTATKTTLESLATKWVATTDKVGIYYNTNGDYTGRNSQYTADSDGFSSPFTGDLIWGEDGQHNFYAYYPYLDGSAAATAVPIHLDAAQTQSGGSNSNHIGDFSQAGGALDFMVANPMLNVTKTGTSPSVDFRYNHVFTVLEFQIAGTGASLGTALKAVKLVVPTNPIAFSGGTIDITLETPAAGISYNIAGKTGTTTQVVVTLTTPVANLTATNTDTKVYMVINPGVQTGNCTIGLYDGTTWTYISKPAPVISGETRGFLRGKKYVVAIDKADAGGAPAIDQDGNTFNTVTIDTQVWMAENLKTTHYNDGTDIPNIEDGTNWGNLTTGAYCWYNNAVDNKATYGALYNWHAVNTGNLCPTGWHVPTDTEWTTLTDYLGGLSVAGGKLKEIGTSHWTTPNEGATNSSGFTALPGGKRQYDYGTFNSISYEGNWWSSSTNYGDPYYMVLYNSNSSVARSGALSTWGFSVRCVKGESTPYLSTTAISAIASNSAISGGEITSDGGSSVTARGVCWNTTGNPTTADTKTSDGSGIGSFTSSMSGLTPNTTYYVRAYATNSIGTGYGTHRNFTTGNSVSDNDGNTYNTVTIGTQVWMSENLKTTKYNDNTGISNVTDNTLWGANTTGAYCWYNNAVDNKATYGALYNWYAANTGKLCPTGWSVPTDVQWTTLTTYLVSDAGNKLKETGTSHWYSSSSGVTNSSGFTALPGGYRYNDGVFNFITYDGGWWSSTEDIDPAYAWSRLMSRSSNSVTRSNEVKKMGFSVRCVKN